MIDDTNRGIQKGNEPTEPRTVPTKRVVAKNGHQNIPELKLVKLCIWSRDVSRAFNVIN